MRISKLRILDKLRRIRLEMPIYASGDRVIDMLLAEGLVIAVPTPGGSRIGVSGSGAAAIREMSHAESHGALRGCWGESVNPRSAGLSRERRAEHRLTRD